MMAIFALVIIVHEVFVAPDEHGGREDIPDDHIVQREDFAKNGHREEVFSRPPPAADLQRNELVDEEHDEEEGRRKEGLFEKSWPTRENDGAGDDEYRHGHHGIVHGDQLWCQEVEPKGADEQHHVDDDQVPKTVGDFFGFIAVDEHFVKAQYPEEVQKGKKHVFQWNDP